MHFSSPWEKKSGGMEQPLSRSPARNVEGGVAEGVEDAAAAGEVTIVLEIGVMLDIV
jgi:hypothetical protein